MKRTAALIALLLAATPALAADAADEEDVRVFEKGLTIDPNIDLTLPEIEIPMPEINQNRPFPVNSKTYKKVRDHLEKYGDDGQTSDGHPARCLQAEESHVWITACMNFAMAEPAGEGIRAMSAVLRWYTGPVEVQVSERVGDEIITRTYYVSTSGKLAPVLETIQPAMPPASEVGTMAEVIIRSRPLAPSSIEALFSWEETAKTILTLVPQIEI